jgi:hypothetical protein
MSQVRTNLGGTLDSSPVDVLLDLGTDCMGMSLVPALSIVLMVSMSQII